MPSPTKWAAIALLLIGAGLAGWRFFGPRPAPPAGPAKPWFQATLLSAAEVDEPLLRASQELGQAIVLPLTKEDAAANRAAAEAAAKAGVAVHYWIEIARDPALAEAHPEWMASLQGHDEWRRLHPQAAKETAGTVVKTYPWVPVLYQEGFDAHLAKVRDLLAALPKPKAIFLNDLQGAPSACGCGHPLCRWTSDYGPIVTAKRLADDAAAKFVRAVKDLAPGAEVIPVWAIECEEHDLNGMCGGVGCFKGKCWKEYANQLAPVAKESDTLATLCLYKEFQRDLPIYGPSGGWVGTAVRTFPEPPRRGGHAVAANRVIAVIQGWDVSEEELAGQTSAARAAGAQGVVVAKSKIAQGWEPQLFQPKAD